MPYQSRSDRALLNCHSAGCKTQIPPQGFYSDGIEITCIELCLTPPSDT